MKAIRLLLILPLLLLFSACQDEEKARIVVRLTDSPGDYSKVNIDIQQIEVHGENGWASLPNINEGVYNLLDFTDGRETVLTSTEYPAGRISQIRLILGSENSVEIDDQTHPLETPSAQQSGLKLQLNADLTPGITYAILIDFDAAKSIATTGNGKFILKPHMKVVSEAQDGAIEGKVIPGELNVAVFAISGQDTLGTTYAKAGVEDFFIGGLPAGVYTISCDPGDLSGYQKVNKESIAVSLGEITSVGTIELPVN
jgi:Domain of unknown function (DUF4382)